MTSPRAAVRGLRPEAALGWGAAAAAVLVVYVVVVLGGGVLLGQTDSPHLGLSVLATAVVAAVAEPIRVRAEHAAARQLDRPLRSPYDVLAEFTHEVTGSDLVGEAPIVIARMLTQSIGVAWTQVWVLVHGRLQLMAAYPPGAGADEEPPTLFDTEAGDGLRAVTVAYAREPLGVLRVREQTGHLLTPVENRLLGGLAAQAGMVLQTAQLRAELAERLEQFTARELELRRARDDLVTTQDLAIPAESMRFMGERAGSQSVEIDASHAVTVSQHFKNSGAHAMALGKIFHPSLDDAFPTVLLEAMAAGLPVVASRVGGIPEIVNDGVTGKLVPPGDAEQLANAIRTVIGASHMGEAARKIASERFSTKAWIDRLTSVYAEVCGTPASPPAERAGVSPAGGGTAARTPPAQPARTPALQSVT